VTQLTIPNPVDLQGQTLIDALGEGIGTIEGVYLDNLTRAPEWAAVRLGPGALALVPLTDASMAPQGLRVEYLREVVLAAPHRLTGLDSQVTEETEAQLYDYYDGTDDPSEPASATNDPASATNDKVAAAAATAAEVASDVKEQVVDVAGTAADEATEVAEEVKDQAAETLAVVVDVAREETVEVAQQVTDEARELYETTKGELQSQAETQLEQLGVALHRLAGQTLALTHGNPEQAGQVGDLVRRAGLELQSVARDLRANGSSGLLEGAQRVVRQRPRAAIFGTALAVVAGAKLMGTPAGDRLKEKLAPLKDQAIEAGRSVAEELVPVAQQRAENVKTVAVQAADEVTREAKGTADDIKGTAAQAGKTVKGTAKRSAADVKTTAKRSAATTKRTARSAAPKL